MGSKIQICILVLALTGLSGCSGKGHRPLVDFAASPGKTPTTYELDLADCRQYAESVSTGRSAGRGGAGGALFGGILSGLFSAIIGGDVGASAAAGAAEGLWEALHPQAGPRRRSSTTVCAAGATAFFGDRGGRDGPGDFTGKSGLEYLSAQAIMTLPPYGVCGEGSSILMESPEYHCRRTDEETGLALIRLQAHVGAVFWN